MALAGILGQATPAGTGPQPFQTHQPLDTVQPGLQPFGKNIVPDPTRPIGAIASGKAGPDLRHQCFVILSPFAGRAIEPGVKARPGDTERLTHPRDRPDHSVLRNEPEDHIESLAK